jgi:hypothetical protein
VTQVCMYSLWLQVGTLGGQRWEQETREEAGAMAKEEGRRARPGWQEELRFCTCSSKIG